MHGIFVYAEGNSLDWVIYLLLRKNIISQSLDILLLKINKKKNFQYQIKKDYVLIKYLLKEGLAT